MYGAEGYNCKFWIYLYCYIYLQYPYIHTAFPTTYCFRFSVVIKPVYVIHQTWKITKVLFWQPAITTICYEQYKLAYNQWPFVYPQQGRTTPLISPLYVDFNPLQNICWIPQWWVHLIVSTWLSGIRRKQKDYCEQTQITKFMEPTWGPPGSCRPRVGPMLAP